MDERLPALLTVEEAGALLRIGRTKAYAMAQQWRATGGQSGLPVVDFGHVLRVPRRTLEELVGTELGGRSGGVAREPAGAEGAGPAAVTVAPPAPAPAEAAVTKDEPARAKSSRPARRQNRNRATDQLDLFSVEQRQS